MNQGTQERAPQGASEHRQVSLPQSKLIPSIIQPTGRIQPLGSGLNGSSVLLSETKRPANRHQPGYSGLFRDKQTKYFCAHAVIPKNRRRQENTKPAPSVSVFFASFAVIQFGWFGFARFRSVCEQGWGSPSCIAFTYSKPIFSTVLTCTRLFSRILT